MAEHTAGQSSSDTGPGPETGTAGDGAAGRSLSHESAEQHVRGSAWYTDDIPEPRGCLYAAIGLASVAHGRIRRLDLEAVAMAPGVVAVITAADIPGENNCGPVVHDDPVFAEGVVEYAGQSLFAVAAHSMRAARQAVRLAEVDYERLPASLDVDSALAAQSHVLPSETLSCGDAEQALATAPRRVSGELRIGGQDQFYLEGQIAMAVPRDGDQLTVYSSTQFPMEVQAAVARCLGWARMSDISVQCRRMGGAFGGKESQPALFACVAALLAERTGRAVKLRVDRDDDMRNTGKRHDFLARYDVGFDDAGRILGHDVMLASRCGRSADLSGAINDRAMLHSDNAYYLPHLRVTSHRLKTHTVSNTAFRGFGGPQGMLVIEDVIEHIARETGQDALDVRLANLYGEGERAMTPYGMRVEGNRLPRILAELAHSSDYRERRAAVRTFNERHRWRKRGIALTPVKFGISFTATHLNQAGALVHLYPDGSVYLNHGGTEMGQGLFTKVAQIVANVLGVDMHTVRASASDTAKVPNASATAASSGTDLNGKAAENAALLLRDRLAQFAAEHFDTAPDTVRFHAGMVEAGNHRSTFAELVQLAYMHRVQLSATGFYKTPKIGYDRRNWQGRPFYYFAYGAAVSEVQVDMVTGEHRIRRADILHDCGRSVNPAIDRGQVEGGFLQGAGWLTSEELVFDAHGHLRTHAPSTYKIPACSDWPDEVRVELLEGAANNEDTVFSSKAVGEPPLMLAISVFMAIKDAVASVAGYRRHPLLHAPATPEAVLAALAALREHG